jgi:pyruvate/2-oxoglutarate dehydrogenase complex dihydrolipoamide dehydrogenase (E3) component
MTEVIVIGAGPARVLAALRGAELGARTALVTSGAFGGMAANDEPVPVRTLAHTARLLRDALARHLRRNPGSRCGQSGTRTRPASGLAKSRGGLSVRSKGIAR